MNFFVKNDPQLNILNSLRGLSYHFIAKDDKGEMNFVRPLGNNPYPRFHLYIKNENDGFNFSLHLDQKQTIYKGSTAHFGEYDGDLVEQEAERIKKVL
jgi:hypothetical protein